MNIGVAYVTPTHKVWLRMEMPEGCTIEEAIQRSGILTQFPEIDLKQQKVGIFGRLAKLNKELEDGDRVEIYRPITADPDQVERRDQYEDTLTHGTNRSRSHALKRQLRA